MLKFLNKLFGIPETKPAPPPPPLPPLPPPPPVPEPEPAPAPIHIVIESPPVEIKPETIIPAKVSKPRGRKPAAKPAAKPTKANKPRKK